MPMGAEQQALCEITGAHFLCKAEKIRKNYNHYDTVKSVLTHALYYNSQSLFEVQFSTL
jgi:hypothetical protein